MCGRYTRTSDYDELSKVFDVDTNEYEDRPRYNVAPRQYIDAVLQTEDDQRVLRQLKWGFVAGWSKTDKYAMINARAETIDEKPTFRQAFHQRPCIIPADGFYEWKQTKEGKHPFYFYPTGDNEMFGFAGLWEAYTDEKTGNLIDSCTIITTEANDVLKPVHDRMPVILKPESYALWLDPRLKTEDRKDFLIPYPDKLMNSHAVSIDVNSIKNNSADLIKPINSL